VIGTVISLKEIIATFGRVLAKDVRYQEISDDEWRRDAVARASMARARTSLRALEGTPRRRPRSTDRRFAVTDTIEKLGGAKPKSFEHSCARDKAS